MTRNFWLGLVFLIFTILITLRKQLLWLYWKYKRLTSKEQAFDLLGKHSFIEIIGPAQAGKSWSLSHIFKNLEGVKLTNLPTPNSNYTLNPQTLQAHMLGKWEVPHKWYYFLDDISTFQQWSKEKLGAEGYIQLTDYIARAAKLGAVFIWTNNGAEVDPCFTQNKNATWTVQWHYKFLNRYSLLGIKTQQKWYDLLPTIIAIDNQEITQFYDKFWNVPRAYHENFLTAITEGTGAKELEAIIAKIKDTNGELDFNNETVKLLQEYLKVKNSEARKVRENKRKKEKMQQDLKDFGLDPSKKITPQDIDQLEKAGKFKYLKDKEASQGNNKTNKNFNKSNQDKLTDINLDDLDLDKVNQDPNDHGESNND